MAPAPFVPLSPSPRGGPAVGEQPFLPWRGGEQGRGAVTFEMSVGGRQDEATAGGAGVLRREDPGPVVGEAW